MNIARDPPIAQATNILQLAEPPLLTIQTTQGFESQRCSKLDSSNSSDPLPLASQPYIYPTTTPNQSSTNGAAGMGVRECKSKTSHLLQQLPNRKNRSSSTTMGRGHKILYRRSFVVLVQTLGSMDEVVEVRCGLHNGSKLQLSKLQL